MAGGCGASDRRPEHPPPSVDAGRPAPPPPPDAGPPRTPDAGPPRDPIPEPAPHLALGAAHSCALINRGQVVCWGSNEYGQLGDPTLPRGRTAKRPVAAPVAGTEDAVRVVAGSFHNCILRASGAVACWGHGAYGELGPTEGEDSPAPRDVPGITDAVQLDAGEAHSCARLATRRIVCWGQNQRGQLGDGTRDDRPTPSPVAGIDDAIAVAAGRYHTCALRASGAVACWGFALEGQTGNGRADPDDAVRPEPRDVPGVGDAIAVATGAAHTCALRRDGTALCWGLDDGGQLARGTGGGDFDASGDAAAIRDLADGAELALGGHFTCVRRSGGAVACAGASFRGEVGDGTRNVRRVLTPVSGLDDAVHLAAGIRHSCAIRRSGTVVCWGSAWRSQLGDGGTRDRLAPVPVQGLRLVSH